MEHTRAFILSVVAAAVAIGCGEFGHPTRPTSTIVGSGRLVSESRPVGAFSAIALSGAGRLIIEHTGYESLQVTAEDNILPHVRTEVRGDRLELGIERGTPISTMHGVLYRLTVREISDLDASGASVLEAYGFDADQLRLTLSGASIATLAGSVRNQTVSIAGASRIIAQDLQGRDIRIEAAGTSYARVWALDALTASASGASTIEYLGDPVLSVSVSGSSVVRRVWP